MYTMLESLYQIRYSFYESRVLSYKHQKLIQADLVKKET